MAAIELSGMGVLLAMGIQRIATSLALAGCCLYALLAVAGVAPRGCHVQRADVAVRHDALPPPEPVGLGGVPVDPGADAFASMLEAPTEPVPRPRMTNDFAPPEPKVPLDGTLR